MTLAGGTHDLGPEDGTLTVDTGRAGPAAAAGHDLTLLVTRWSARVVVDARWPSRSTVTLTADPASLVVESARGGVTPLRESQRDQIAETIRDTVLRARRHRSIDFTSTEVAGTLRAGTVTGELTLVGRTRPVAVAVTVAASRGATTRVTATAEVRQTEFGITPYSAMLGALRVGDAVTVRLHARLPSRV